MLVIRNFRRHRTKFSIIENMCLQQLYRYNSNCGKPPPTSSKYSREAVRENVKGYMITRVFDMVKNYDKVLEKNFPSAVKVYRIFFDGVREFYKDMKHYLKISRILNTSPEGPRALTRQELELYQRMPQDMIKIAPTLFFSSLPFIGYLAFPIAYMYPRKFLTSHFWTLSQKSEFQQQILKERLSHNLPVFRYLQAKLGSVKKDPNYHKWRDILGLLGSGVHPAVEDILSIKDIFTKPPYTLRSFSQKHLKHLCYLHNLRAGIFKTIRLVEHANLVHQMDLAIKREGDVHNMHPDALKYSCFLRGLNPSNMNNEKMIEWLRSWVEVSLCITEEHISLFLHLPIIIGYNHPNNWILIYK